MRRLRRLRNNLPASYPLEVLSDIGDLMFVHLQRYTSILESHNFDWTAKMVFQAITRLRTKCLVRVTRKFMGLRNSDDGVGRESV